MPENEGADCREGTFGKLLRYGIVNPEHTRASIKYMEAQRPRETLKKGLLEV